MPHTLSSKITTTDEEIALSDASFFFADPAVFLNALASELVFFDNLAIVSPLPLTPSCSQTYTLILFLLLSALFLCDKIFF